MPKPGIKQVQYGVFSSSHITIYCIPPMSNIRINQYFIIFWIHKSEVIPTASSPLRHSVCFSFALQIISQFNIYKAVNCCKWGKPISGRLIFFNFRKLQWQIVICYNLAFQSIFDRRKNLSINNQILSLFEL